MAPTFIGEKIKAGFKCPVSGDLQAKHRAAEDGRLDQWRLWYILDHVRQACFLQQLSRRLNQCRMVFVPGFVLMDGCCLYVPLTRRARVNPSVLFNLARLDQPAQILQGIGPVELKRVSGLRIFVDTGHLKARIGITLSGATLTREEIQQSRLLHAKSLLGETYCG